MQVERTLSLATRFLEEVRADVERAALDGGGVPPRLRCVHTRAGHSTPEFRTVAIPVPDGAGPLPPDALSGVIATWAARQHPECLFLVMEADMDGGPAGPRQVLIAEARDRGGTRLYWIQPFHQNGQRVAWDPPLDDGWRDPGGEEMILDAAFANGAAVAVGAGSGGVGTPARAGRR